MTTDLEERLADTLRRRASTVSCDRWPEGRDLPARATSLVAVPTGAEPRGTSRRGRGAVWIAVAAALAVAVLAAGLTARHPGSRHERVADGQPMPAEVASAMATVHRLVREGRIFGQVGIGTASRSQTLVSGPALTSDGKPEVLFVGAEWCPYCAAERWALVLALSRFGSFTSLGYTTSASDDVFPDTPSFSFHGATYESRTLAFVGIEMQDRDRRPLDEPTAEQQRILTADDPTGSIPFIDVGGRYVTSTATYDIAVLQGLSMGQIAHALRDPSSPVSQAIVGAADQLTAEICAVTGDHPASACR